MLLILENFDLHLHWFDSEQRIDFTEGIVIAILVVFAILLILPAAIIGALHMVDTKVIPLMLSPSGTLLGVVFAYVSRKEEVNAVLAVD